MNTFTIPVIQPFDYAECLSFLSRSDLECTHTVVNDQLIRLIHFQDQPLLFSVTYRGSEMIVTIRHPTSPLPSAIAPIKKYVSDWFDVEGPLHRFYTFAENNTLLNPLCTTYSGLRLIGIPDFFEAACWAIIGQQINLRFAYQTKRQLVHRYGRHVTYKGQLFYDFPSPATIASLQIEDLRVLQFSRQKSEYLIGLAKLMEDGKINIDQLSQLDLEEATQQLCAIRGIGNWTAQYILLKCFRRPNAFPIQDVGLHNALKTLLKLEQKPDIKAVEKITKDWGCWKGYATFYCWRALLDI